MRRRTKSDDAQAKKARTKKPSMNVTIDRRDRSFDRGSIASNTYAGLAGNLLGVQPLLPVRGSSDADADEDQEGGEVGDDPETRESVKASSRSKIVAKKRVAGSSSSGHLAVSGGV